MGKQMEKYKLFINNKSFAFNDYTGFKIVFNNILTKEIKIYSDFVLHFIVKNNIQYTDNKHYRKIWNILNKHKNEDISGLILIS